MITEDVNEFLLYLYESADFCPTCGSRSNEQAKTLKEATFKLMWLKKRTAAAIGTAENFGMIRGSWERISETNQRWVRRYYLAGEGTRNYIQALHSSSRTRAE